MNTTPRGISFDSVTIDLHEGLRDEQVAQSAEKYGSNILTPPAKDPWWKLLLEKFDDPTIRILLAAAAISLVMTVLEKYVLNHAEASFIDSIGIIFAVLLATLAGFFSEMKSAREFELLNKVKDDIRIKVLRRGQITEVSIHEIVVGDLVHLDLGDKIPADGIVLDAMGLLVDQAVMTGESVPVEKTPLHVEGDLYETYKSGTLDDRRLVYRGTMVSDGHGLFLVTEVGDNTRLGQIAAKLGKEGESENETPLTQKLGVLARQISVVGMTGAMTIFAVMAARAIGQSELFYALLEDRIPCFALASCSVALGLSAAFFVLRPFFASMNMKTNDVRLLLLASLPLIIGFFGLCVGAWGVLDDHGNIPPAMEMLRDLLTCFVIAVTIIVVAVPEGLPMMVTVSLAMNMMKMTRENVLVRKLVASETIGSATIICSDKTGTLTQNRMSVAWVFLGMKQYDTSEHGTSDRNSLKALPEWPLLVDSIAINSEASLHWETSAASADGKMPARTIVEGIGNPTECALLRMLYECGVDYREYRERFVRLGELAHNSQRKMSIVIVETTESQTDSGVLPTQHSRKKRCFAKGAPERLLQRCSGVFIEGNIEPISDHLPVIRAALEHATGKALRVIALALKDDRIDAEKDCYRDEDVERCLQCGGNTLLGLIGIADPIRPEIRAAVDTCRQAGIDVKMITGDAEPTAIAIAKQAGILSEHFVHGKDNREEIEKGELVLTSAELAQWDDRQLLDAVSALRVLARSTPMDKLRLVKAMHREGEVVAMTGDGTNDAPALKFADVGISMGITGTEVAKEASDIVLLDDNFKSIVTGVWWGRTLYQNIQRFLQFQLSVNAVALTCALLGPLVGVPLPLTVPQLLWINIIMDTFAAIAYSTDPPRAGSMRRKPVSRDGSIITPSMGLSVVLCSVYQVAILFTALWSGWFVEPEPRQIASLGTATTEIAAENGPGLQALTIFFTIFIMFQFWHKFNCRSLRYDESPFTLLSKNRLFIVIIGVITVLQIVMVQASDAVPAIGRIFRTESLSLRQWVEISLLTATILPVAWLVRRLIHRLGFDEEK